MNDADQGADDGPGGLEERPSAPIAFWTRIGLFCLSAFFLTVGIASVFRTDNEGATTALVIGGMAVALVAVLGEVPAKGSIGGVAWDLQKKLLRSPNRQVAEEAAQGVLDAATTTGQVPSTIVATARKSLKRVGVDYYHEVRDALFRVANGTSGLTVDTGVRYADALLRGGNRTVLVETKFRLVRGPHELVDHLHTIVRRVQESTSVSIDGVLFVTPELTPTQMQIIKSGAADLNVRIALWDGDADDSLLTEAILSLLSREDYPT